ncbi:hypothetical protein D3C84_1016660 [compost metagenome]
MVGEELLGVGLLNFPRRVAQQRIKAVLSGGEHIRELQLPVEKALAAGYFAGNGQRMLIGVGKLTRQRCQLDLLAGPEPQCAP